MKITRFAPSNTSYLHIGNIRTAFINYVFAKKFDGKFILRIDDTNADKIDKKYELAIIEDLKWLGISWDAFFRQSERKQRYNECIAMLKNKGIVYECYETQEELEHQRNQAIAGNRPFVYNRSALEITEQKRREILGSGRRGYLRFKINRDIPINFKDLIKGDMHFDSNLISDPVIMRENGDVTYLFSSVIDDIDYEITDIIRGEDHLSNTAIQIHIMMAMDLQKIPNFGHLPLLHTENGKISKRIGGYTIKELREAHISPMAVNNLLFNLGNTSNEGQHEFYKSIDDGVKNFDIDNISSSHIVYDKGLIEKYNRNALRNSTYEEIKNNLLIFSKVDKLVFSKVAHDLNTKENFEKISENDRNDGHDNEFRHLVDKSTKISDQYEIIEKRFSKEFFDLIKNDINQIGDILRWLNVVYKEEKVISEKAEFEVNSECYNKYHKYHKYHDKLRVIEELVRQMPEKWDVTTIKEWIKKTATIVEIKNGELMHFCREILIGMDGPNLVDLLLIFGREKVTIKLSNISKYLSVSV